MNFIEQCKLYYYKKEYLNSISRLIKENLNNDFELGYFELAKFFEDIITTPPSSYWLQDVYDQTFEELDKFFNDNQIIIDNEIIDYFIIALNTYFQITETINDLSSINDSDIIKNRQYRIPTYISIVEGCITNIFRFICLLINQTSDKDYASNINKLFNLCQTMSSNGYEKASNNVNVNIRNAINHGRVVFLEDGRKIEFRYNVGNQNKRETITSWDFEDMIEKSYDTARALILSILSILNNHHDTITIDYNCRDYTAFNYLLFKIASENIKCEYIDDIDNKKQININNYTTITNREQIFQSAVCIALLVYDVYSDYDKYLIGFRSERMQSGWIIFTNKQIYDIAYKKREINDVLREIIKSKNGIIFDPATEEIDLREIKYFRFPNYFDEELQILQIEDASNETKRLRCNMYIGNVEDKKEILRLVDKAIHWLKTLRNVDSPTFHRKNGVMEADSLYINVYRVNERKNKSLLPTNENFVCMVDYNKSGTTTLLHGGILKSIWNQLYIEQIGNIQYAWRESKYYQRIRKKVGVNDPCPCGSGRKYKKCCMNKKIKATHKR